MHPSPLSALGQTYHDFTVTKYLPLDELQSSLIELIHGPTGARVIHIANDDPEKPFLPLLPNPSLKALTGLPTF